jgi:hypothetical protein
LTQLHKFSQRELEEVQKDLNATGIAVHCEADLVSRVRAKSHRDKGPNPIARNTPIPDDDLELFPANISYLKSSKRICKACATYLSVVRQIMPLRIAPPSTHTKWHICTLPVAALQIDVDLVLDSFRAQLKVALAEHIDRYTDENMQLSQPTSLSSKTASGLGDTWLGGSFVWSEEAPVG